MLIFFDMEFTGLRKNTAPISLGMVTEHGDTFYAEFTDYNKNHCDRWIQQNVLKNLLFKERESFCDGFKNVRVKGGRMAVSDALNEWMMEVVDNNAQFVSDVCHYDFVLLIDIITHGKTAMHLPGWISAVCHDINQDIARHYGISDAEAFDKSREEIVMELCAEPVQGEKHNSLYDSMVIKAIYEEITK